MPEYLCNCCTSQTHSKYEDRYQEEWGIGVYSDSLRVHRGIEFVRRVDRKCMPFLAGR